MRKSFTYLLAASAAFTLNTWAFNAGDPLTPDALGKAIALKGEAPKAWEPGKVYVVECWATWCGPCVAAIPHVDALYDKYQDKGLRVISVDVFEDGQEKVAAFVAKKGDGMSYPVLFAGKEGSDFDRDWLKPDQVNGIPHAFVVKDGKFLFSTHPMKLSEELIESLLAGGEKQEAAIKALKDGEVKESAANVAMGEYFKAERANDVATMEKKLAEFEKLAPDSPYLPQLRIYLATAKKEWSSVEKLVAELPDDTTAIVRIGIKLDSLSDLPDSTRKVMAARLSKLQIKDSDALQHVLLSRYQWMTGDKEAAIASAQKAVKNPGAYPAKIFPPYADSLATDKPQTFKEVFDAFQKAAREETAE